MNGSATREMNPAPPNVNGEAASAETTTSSPSKDAMKCILRKGDLVRVAERREARAKNRDGGLGRIHRSIPIPEEQIKNGDHPLRYDVDWVLGGRLASVQRSELVYTTADAEGLTEDGTSMRARRSRKAPAVDGQDVPLVKKKKVQAKKKPPAKKKVTASSSKKAGAKKKAAPTSKPKNGIAKRKCTTSSAGQKETAKRKKTEPAATQAKSEEDDAMPDLYDRHRREFERCFARLEKSDIFGFFLSHASSDFQEQYDYDACDISDVAAEVSESQSPSESAETEPPPGPTSKLPVFPSQPPFNWEMLHRRASAGRYVLDRMRQAEDERKRIRSSEGLSETSAQGERDTGNSPLVLVNTKGVDWDLFRHDVMGMCDAALSRDPSAVDEGSGTLGHAANKIKDVLEQIYQRTGKRQKTELVMAESRRKFTMALKDSSNTEAAMQGKWRQTPFPERKYERLQDNVVCAGLSKLDEHSAIFELRTNLPDSFVGLSYTYNDTGQSESWMMSVVDEAGKPRAQKRNFSESDERLVAEAMAADEGVVRAQAQATMGSLLISVQDRVMTESGVLKAPELRSANWDGDESHTPVFDTVSDVESERMPGPPAVVEQPVWGIDCYTRRNITICLEVDFEPRIALEFIERWLLPAINACPVDLACNLASATRILEGLPIPAVQASDVNNDTFVEQSNVEYDERWSHSLLGRALKEKIDLSAPAWLRLAARCLREAIGALGYDFFRIHPKGHGSIVLKSQLKANSLVTYYRGEVYPSWRWGEKMDAIEMTQERLGVRPNLPDFYNMALERPQLDPRGYGLLFVDASRKAGHGSSLSHSCAPTCEVRVAALHGKLCLAMTTLRDLELGEELTFDYNAVTESLGEYSSAVCLCGHGNCRGSFLHFATADCYQQVLNRNSPIAVRFANLVKGCTKKVMSEDDSKLLISHGFGTAAFGAVCVECCENVSQTGSSKEMDLLEKAPIWLRTYVADTLRYIEYERRALPVSLLCNHFSSAQTSVSAERARRTVERAQKKEKAGVTKQNAKPFGEEVVLRYFIRKQRKFFLSELNRHGAGDLTSSALQKALRDMGTSAWDALGVNLKKQWRREARIDWRKAEDAKKTGSRSQKQILTPNQRSKPGRSTNPDTHSGVLATSTISFEAADAEGVLAMEQRIQQLTQALSRVGRVLGRHRESAARAEMSRNDQSSDIHEPLLVLSEKEVVDWIWNDQRGVVRNLVACCETEPCVSPALRKEIRDFVSSVTTGTDISSEAPASHGERLDKEKVVDSLLSLRRILLGGIRSMDREMKNNQLERERRNAQARRDALKKRKREEEALCLEESHDVKAAVSRLLSEMVNAVAGRAKGGPDDKIENAGCGSSDKDAVTHDPAASSGNLPRNPWHTHYHNKWKLEAAADLLLFYAHTSTFFALRPYQTLVSSPVQVYARELGNQVPRSLVEVAHGKNGDSIDEVVVFADSQNDKATGKSRRPRFCEPDDVITNVTVSYQGDYVLSQLLQWSNAGIGQKQGLPDVLGCVALPHMSGCWRDVVTKTGTIRKFKPDYYRSEIRPILVDWLSNPLKRGSPLPDSVRHVFAAGDTHSSSGAGLVVFGSPVLDLLVSARDEGIFDILERLTDGVCSASIDRGDTPSKSAAERLQSTVDVGMPAQAVANWVQCDNEDCLKWRRLPWHVDVDALPEKFVCADNKWDAAARSCDAPEDPWDENDAQLKNGGIAKQSDLEMVSGVVLQAELEQSGHTGKSLSGNQLIKKSDFVIGARFDTLRFGKKKYCTGVVVDTDFDGDTLVRVKFHFSKTLTKFDEWIEVDSDRIAPFLSIQHGVGAKIGDQKGSKAKTKAAKSIQKKSIAPKQPNKTRESKKAKREMLGGEKAISALEKRNASPKNNLQRPFIAQEPPVSVGAASSTSDAATSRALNVQVLAERISRMSGVIADTVIKNRVGPASAAQSESRFESEHRAIANMIALNSTQIAEKIANDGSLGVNSTLASRSIMAAVTASTPRNSASLQGPPTMKINNQPLGIMRQAQADTLTRPPVAPRSMYSNQSLVSTGDHMARYSHPYIALNEAPTSQNRSISGVSQQTMPTPMDGEALSGIDSLQVSERLVSIPATTQHIPTMGELDPQGIAIGAVAAGSMTSPLIGRIPKKATVHRPTSLIQHPLQPSTGGDSRLHPTSPYHPPGASTSGPVGQNMPGLHYQMMGFHRSDSKQPAPSLDRSKGDRPRQPDHSR